MFGLKWDLNYEKYNNATIDEPLSGGIIFAIVFAGVAFLMLMVHIGSRLKKRASEMAKRREEELNVYEEVTTPLVSQGNQSFRRESNNVDLSVELEDSFFSFNKDPEVLYEGDFK